MIPAAPPSVPERPPTGPPASLGRYAVGVFVTVFAVLSQYFLPEAVPALRPIYGTLAGDLAIVYGVPILAFALLVGTAPLRNWADRMGLAAVEGLRWYGLLSLLALVVLFVLVILYLALDPSALSLLSRPNPALEQARSNPWFFVGLSFVVGGLEETIFRGWIFGFWRDRAGSWLVPATWTSALFAGVHLYYATTYGVAAPLIFPALFLLGFAFAGAYRASGGNLVVVALLHGAHDGTAFLMLVNPGVATALSYLLILVGAAIGLVLYFRRDDGPLPRIARI
jgi:membrane protease YdiL (CAAX protease family)